MSAISWMESKEKLLAVGILKTSPKSWRQNFRYENHCLLRYDKAQGTTDIRMLWPCLGVETMPSLSFSSAQKQNMVECCDLCYKKL